MKGKREIVVSFFLLFDPLENDLLISTHGGYYWIFVDKEGFLRMSFTSGLINRSSRGETNFNYLEN